MPKKLEDHTLVELREKAAKRGLKGYSRMKKEDLVEALRAKKSGSKSPAKKAHKAKKGGKKRGSKAAKKAPKEKRVKSADIEGHRRRGRVKKAPTPWAIFVRENFETWASKNLTKAPNKKGEMKYPKDAVTKFSEANKEEWIRVKANPSKYEKYTKLAAEAKEEAAAKREKIVKRPLSAYMLYQQALAKDGTRAEIESELAPRIAEEYARNPKKFYNNEKGRQPSEKQIIFAEISRAVRSRWLVLGAAEKKRFEDMSKKDMAEYHRLREDAEKKFGVGSEAFQELFPKVRVEGGFVRQRSQT